MLLKFSSVAYQLYSVHILNFNTYNQIILQRFTANQNYTSLLHTFLPATEDVIFINLCILILAYP
jgi:hypothetical protein